MGVNPMRAYLILILLLISVSTSSGAVGGREFQITDAPGEQRYAYINENKIVWMDKRTGDYDIRVYDFGPDGIFNTSDDGGERLIANTPSLNEYYPDIYGDLVTYAVTEFDIYDAEKNKLNASIYIFNLTSNVTVDLIPPDEDTKNYKYGAYQCCPQLYNITISWYDYRDGNYDIYVYDLGPDGTYGTSDDGGEFQVTDDPANQKPMFIWGRNIVWTDYRNGKADVYLYDAGPDERFNTEDDRGEFRVTNLPVDQKVWDVREHMIVWRDRRNWGGAYEDIYGYDMGPDGAFGTSDDRGEFRVTDEPANQMYPIVYSNIIVWRDSRNGNTDVYIYDLGPDEIFNTSDDGGEIPLVTNIYNQERIEMHKGRIVYDDNRDGDQDIYMYDLTFQEGGAEDTVKPTSTPVAPSSPTTTPAAQAPTTTASEPGQTPAPGGGLCGPTAVLLLAMLLPLIRYRLLRR